MFCTENIKKSEHLKPNSEKEKEKLKNEMQNKGREYRLGRVKTK